MLCTIANNEDTCQLCNGTLSPAAMNYKVTCICTDCIKECALSVGMSHTLHGKIIITVTIGCV